MISPTTEKITTSAKTIPPIGIPRRNPSLIPSATTLCLFQSLYDLTFGCLIKINIEMNKRTQ